MKSFFNKKTKNIWFALSLYGIFTLAGCSSLSSSSQGSVPTPPPQLTKAPATQIPTSTPSTEDTPTTTSSVSTTPVPTATPAPLPTPTGTSGDVCFSEAGYFFAENTLIELSINSKKGGYITYTMNGTEPTETDTLYTEPILLVTTTGDFPNAYSIRAKAWYDDGSVSDTYVHTYFLSETIDNRYSTIIFSINGDPAELTNGPDGILYGENYKQRGRESERKVHIEAITNDGLLMFEQFAGVRVNGGTSRKHAVKSLKLYARKDYEKGKGSFTTTLFGTKTTDGKDFVNKYDSFVLRGGGDDFQSAFLRDELVQRLAANSGFSPYEAAVPALAYINGEYYGYYWLHETYCDKYFQYRNGKSDGEYVILEGSDYYKSISGDDIEAAAAKEYNELYKKYAYSDLTDEKNYKELSKLIDIENYLDYMSINMYVANYDWPQGNYRCFRYYATDGEDYGSGEKDGRWRFLLHDTDVGFGTYQPSEDAGAARNDLKEVLANPKDKRYAPLLAALLKREDCRQYFIDKMLYYMNDAFSYEKVCETLEQLCAERDTELTYYFEYLNTLKANGTPEIYATPKRTEDHLTRIRSFAQQRPIYMTEYLEDFFGIELNAGNE